MIVGCGKAIPRGAMALASRDVPGLVLCGGTIAPGKYKGRDMTVQDVFEAVGAHAAGTIDDAELEAVEAAACPGPGACGGPFTPDTISRAVAFLGINPPRAHRAAPLDLSQIHRGPRRLPPVTSLWGVQLNS